VIIGPGVVITNDVYPRAFIWNEKRMGKTLIKKGASIGANSTIICGHMINEYAMVGASSVVTKNVPKHALVYGNPAKLHGFVCKCGKKLEQGKEKNNWIVLECLECKEKIRIVKDVYEKVI
jgi:acetyltransferase-like isoleucine patch superfamily enzyme